LADGHHEIPPRLSSIRSRSAIVIMVNAGGSGGTGPQSLLPKLAKLHAQQRESRMRTHVWGQIQSRDLWIHEIGLRRFLRALYQLLPIDGLHNASRARPVHQEHA